METCRRPLLTCLLLRACVCICVFARRMSFHFARERWFHRRSLSHRNRSYAPCCVAKKKLTRQKNGQKNKTHTRKFASFFERAVSFPLHFTLSLPDDVAHTSNASSKRMYAAAAVCREKNGPRVLRSEGKHSTQQTVSTELPKPAERYAAACMCARF